MEKRSKIAYVYLGIGVAALLFWPMISARIWPPPPKKPRVPNDAELVGFAAGGLAPVHQDIYDSPEQQAERIARKGRLEAGLMVLGGVGASTPPMSTVNLATLAPDQEALVSALGGPVAFAGAGKRFTRSAAVPAAPSTPPTLVGAGREKEPYHLQVLFTTRGGAIQQVVTTRFQAADRVGLGVTENGKSKPLGLIPGIRSVRPKTIRGLAEPTAELSEGELRLSPHEVEYPSYEMYHYEDEDSDKPPVTTLANRDWTVAENTLSEDGNRRTITFETELGKPHYVRIRKTYTVARDEYHIGLKIELTPTPRPPGVKPMKFRYQLDGPRGLPIEGEWYTTTYRTGVVGWEDAKGNATRILEDPREVSHLGGSERHLGKSTKPIVYVGMMVQYFGSVMAVDDQQVPGQKRDFIEAVRFSPHGPSTKAKEFLDDMTFRAISRPIDWEAVSNEKVTHAFLLYHGPVKVRLLNQLKGKEAVPEELVTRYRDKLHLNTLTDAPMPNALGRFANAIFWTDIVIFFTNVIHSLLGILSQFIPWLGVCIIVITVMVRGMLFPFSRRQSLRAKVMQEGQARLAPEIKKLTEKYGHDFSRLNQEKMKLFRENGINPAAMMGGCLLLFAQMPVFMGLYYALQESIFLRLDRFLWMPNLAAPDMLFSWSESIPFISVPDDLGGILYLGPFFNILPIISVGLMMYTQSKMMPKSDDPQVEMQRKTMKIMMFMMTIFFYKVAAGLGIYFICSSIWGMIERKLLPKTAPPGSVPVRASGTSDGPVVAMATNAPVAPPKPKGWLGRKMAQWREKWQQILREAEKQQQLRKEGSTDSSSSGSTGGGGAGGGGGGNREMRRQSKKRRR